MADERDPMAAKTRKKTTKPPPAPRTPPVSVGVTSVWDREPDPQALAERKVTGPVAAEAYPGFREGGAAFAAWCREKGIDPDLKRFESDWTPLIIEFESRPIHGHRRGPGGGTHRR